MYVASNLPNAQEEFIEYKHYNLSPTYAFSNNLQQGFHQQSGDKNYKFLWGNDENSLGEKFGIKHGFYYTEKIDSSNYIHYFFCCNEHQIYDVLINSILTTKAFITYFKQTSEKIINERQDRKINISERKSTYFTQIKRPFKTEKERAINLFHVANLLNKNETLTNREFECMKYYCQGETAKTTGKTLNISPRTVETYLVSVKEKFDVHSREELLKKIGEH